MKSLCVKLIFLIFLFQIIFPQRSFGIDRKEELIQKIQKDLFRWNVYSAKDASQELLRLDGKGEVSLYLAGSVSFFEGDYSKADQFFERVKNLNQFEESIDGFAYLTKKVLNEGISFKRKKITHFQIHFQKGPDEIMLDYMEKPMDKIRNQVGKALDFYPSEKVLIEIFPSADSFIAASPLTEKEVKTSGTIALCKYSRILLTTPRSLLRGYPWLDTISHEYVHYILSRKWGGKIPVWFHEALAKYLEAKWRDSKDGYLEPSYQHLLAEALRLNQFVTFSEMHPSFAKLPSAKQAQLAYAQVVSLLDFIIVEKGGWKTVHALLDLMSNGEEYDQAFVKVLNLPMQNLLREWKAWLRKKNLKEIKGLDPETLYFVNENQNTSSPENEQSLDQRELKQIASTSAREHVYLGDLLRYRGRYIAAIKEYDRAQQLVSGISPIISTKLGLSYQLTGQLDPSEEVLKKTLKIYPHQGLAYRILGDVYMMRKDYQRAVDFYEQAIYINPFNPRLHLALFKAYQKLGMKNEAKKEKEILSLLIGEQSKDMEFLR